MFWVFEMEGNLHSNDSMVSQSSANRTYHVLAIGFCHLILAYSQYHWQFNLVWRGLIQFGLG